MCVGVMLKASEADLPDDWREQVAARLGPGVIGSLGPSSQSTLPHNPFLKEGGQEPDVPIESGLAR